jgi:hypothetical protein
MANSSQNGSQINARRSDSKRHYALFLLSRCHSSFSSEGGSHTCATIGDDAADTVVDQHVGKIRNRGSKRG